MKIFFINTSKHVTSKKGLNVLLLLVAFFLPPAELTISAENTITPEHEIKIEIEQQGSVKPEWKMLWDRARSLVRQNYLIEAKYSYEQLFSLKPSIVAATWEYCKLLLRLEEWEESAPVIERLLELEPNNQEFLLAGGEIALTNNHFNKATEYFGQVFENDPVGPFSKNAIEGLVEALTELDNKKAAYLLLEQYIQRGNEDDATLVQLGRLSLDLGYYKKSRRYYTQLVARYPQNKEYIFQIAHIHEYLGDFESAAKYWREYLALDPESQYIHLKLADFYLDGGVVKKAVPHLEKVYVLGGRQDRDLALKIADLYYEQLGRKDKALLYYERYHHPQRSDQKILRRLESIRESLAKEYLPIVENGAADNLWRDLEHVTADKTDIFERIARLLKNKQNHLAETKVIEILYTDSSEKNLDLAYRLAELYRDAGRRQKAYELLVRLDEQAYANKSYLRSKAELEILNNDEKEALGTYMRYLENVPSDLAALTEALSLAGDLGLVKKVEQLWRNIPRTVVNDQEFLAIKLQYTEALRKNSLYSRADQMYAELFEEYKEDFSALSKIYYHLAETLKHRGFYFKAEQLYRQNIARNMMAPKAIRELVRLAINQDQHSLAESWLELLAQGSGIEDLEDNREELPENIHFLFIEFLLGSDEFGDTEM